MYLVKSNSIFVFSEYVTTLTWVLAGLTSKALAIVLMNRFVLTKLSSPKLAEASKKKARSVLRTSWQTEKGLRVQKLASALFYSTFATKDPFRDPEVQTGSDYLKIKSSLSENRGFIVQSRLITSCGFAPFLT